MGGSDKYNIQGHKLVHTIIKGISPTANEAERLEFELAYFEAAVQHISYDYLVILTCVMQNLAFISTH